MPTRKLSKMELADLFQPLGEEVAQRLQTLSGGDTALLWALRRKLAKTLIYQERGTPMHRRKIKMFKFAEQQGKCAECGQPLPALDTILDRIDAMKGYTIQNTRILCRPCDFKIQTGRNFS